MSKLKAKCKHCGYIFQSRGFDVRGSTGVTFKDCQESCPHCNQLADVQSGTFDFDFAGNIFQAFADAGANAESVASFQMLAKSVLSGQTSKEDAEAQAEKINPQFGAIWKSLNENAGGISIVVMILGLILSYYAVVSSNAGSAQAHEDAQHQLQATQTVAQASLNAQQVQQRIYELLQQQSAPSPRQATPKTPKPGKKPPRQSRTKGHHGSVGREKRPRTCRLDRFGPLKPY